MLSQKRTYEILEVANPGDRVSRVVDLGILVLILLNVAAVVLESVPTYGEAYASAFAQFELISATVFTIEYAFRLWSCVSDPNYASPIAGRLRFALSPLVLIDLLAVLPYFLGHDARFLRILRVLKLARYMEALRTFQRVVYRKRGQLFATLIVLSVMLLLTSCIIWVIERDRNPNIGSIPDAMWWSIVTLTTVGFGDTVPMTPVGRFAAGVVAIIGVSMFAFPTAVLGAGFLEETAGDQKKCPHCGEEI